MFKINAEVCWDLPFGYGVEYGTITAISGEWAIVEYGPWGDKMPIRTNLLRHSCISSAN